MRLFILLPSTRKHYPEKLASLPQERLKYA